MPTGSSSLSSVEKIFQNYSKADEIIRSKSALGLTEVRRKTNNHFEDAKTSLQQLEWLRRQTRSATPLETKHRRSPPIRSPPKKWETVLKKQDKFQDIKAIGHKAECREPKPNVKLREILLTKLRNSSDRKRIENEKEITDLEIRISTKKKENKQPKTSERKRLSRSFKKEAKEAPRNFPHEAG